MSIAVEVLIGVALVLGILYAVINAVQERRRRLAPPEKHGPVFHDRSGTASD